MAVDAIKPQPTSSPSSRHPSTTTTPMTSFSTRNKLTATTTTTTSSFSASSRRSLASVRSSLPENPHLYDISEIRLATNNFLAKSYTATSPSSTRCWRCTLHGKEVIVFQRKSHTQLSVTNVRQKLSSICKSHHIAIVNLLGASIIGEYVYLVYDFVRGANLHDLLHNAKNPDFTSLSTWMSRMQIASDIANGLDYIHNNSGLDATYVHNHVKSSSVIVSEPSLNAKLCHFGVAELCGEPVEERERETDDLSKNGMIEEQEEVGDTEEIRVASFRKLTRTNSVKFNGRRGYMSPEFQATGVGTRKSDVYAFGVVLIELLSGEEPVKYKFDKSTKDYIRISAVEAARAVVESGGGSGGEREGRLRKWIDRRLNDSFPVEVAEALAQLAVDCVDVDPNKRPDMRRVAGKMSKFYLKSEAWCDKMNVPTDFTVSFAAR